MEPLWRCGGIEFLRRREPELSGLGLWDAQAIKSYQHSLLMAPGLSIRNPAENAGPGSCRVDSPGQSLDPKDVHGPALHAPPLS